jgi:hypothetical protein
MYSINSFVICVSAQTSQSLKDQIKCLFLIWFCHVLLNFCIFNFPSIIDNSWIRKLKMEEMLHQTFLFIKMQINR